jgi:hypothetical protein
MPIWLRNFTTQSIKKALDTEAEAQKEAHEKASGIQKATAENSTPNRVQVPDVVQKANYTAKVAKKQ